MILYHFNQLDTTVWLWHVGSVRHLDTGASDLWQWWIFRHLPAQNGLFEREMCLEGGSKSPHVQKRPKMWPDGRFWGQIPFHVLCHTLDLLDIGLGDLWQGPILDRTLGPVTCDCLIDWNGTVTVICRPHSWKWGDKSILHTIGYIYICTFYSTRIWLLQYRAYI